MKLSFTYFVEVYCCCYCYAFSLIENVERFDGTIPWRQYWRIAVVSKWTLSMIVAVVSLDDVDCDGFDVSEVLKDGPWSPRLMMLWKTRFCGENVMDDDDVNGDVAVFDGDGSCSFACSSSL